jgi:hypothetical protein
MAGSEKRSGIVVDIGLVPRKKRAAAKKADDDDDELVAEADDVADVRGEVIAKRILRAFKADDSAALSAALKAHYEHCRDDVDSDDETDGGGLAGLLGSGGKRSEY